jgi:hypothetical protein
MTAQSSSVQDRYPNYREDGRLFLLRCFVCGGTYGRENWSPAVSSGECAWCGWSDANSSADLEVTDKHTEVEDA